MERMDTETYSVEQAGRILGISRGAAYAACRRGEIPVLRLGHRLLVPKPALARMLRGDHEAEVFLGAPAGPDA